MQSFLTKSARALRGPFVRNFATVMAGSALSQVIYVAAAPALSRIYPPEAFGVTGVLMSVAAILIPISSFTLDLAIVLPRRSEVARGLLLLAVSVTGIVVFMSSIILFFFNSAIAHMLSVKDSSLLYFLPILIIFSGCSEIFTRWLMRSERFQLISAVRIVVAFGASGLKIVCGLVHPSALVLMGANAIAAAMQLTLILYYTLPKLFDASTLMDLTKEFSARQYLRTTIDLFREYIDFPKYKAPQMLLQTLSNNFPLVVIGALAGAHAAGLYSIARAALSRPSRAITNSLWTVLHPKFAQVSSRSESILWHLMVTTAGLAVVGLPIFGSVALFGPALFAFVFGEEWRYSGEIGRYLALGLYMSFVGVPATTALTVIRQQRSLLIFDLIGFPVRIIALVVGIRYFGSVQVGVMAMSLVSAADILLRILWAMAKCRSRGTPFLGEH